MTDRTPTADALMRTILAAPSDPFPRLVFADWLDETDSDANHAWAKYLRLAVDLAHTPLTPVRRAYLEALQIEVAQEVRAALTVRAEQFLEHRAAFQQLLPTRCLTLNCDSLTLAAVRNRMTATQARRFSALPIDGGDHLLVAVEPGAVDVQGEQLEAVLRRRVQTVKATRESLLRAIDRHYPSDSELATAILPLAEQTEADVSLLQREAESGPVARVLSLMLADAFAQSAREVTIERYGPRVEVRFLQSGERNLWGGLPERLHLPVVARLQWLAGLNLGPSPVDQIGTLPYIHQARLIHCPLRVRPSRSGPRATLMVPTGHEPNPAA